MFSRTTGWWLALASASMLFTDPSQAQITPPLRPSLTPSLPEPQPLDRPPFCLAPLVASRTRQPLQAVNPTANTICQFFPNPGSPPCGTLTAADQLTLISPSSYDADGFRLSNSDPGAYVDVPIPIGQKALFAQEATDLPIRFVIYYDLNGRTSELSSGLAIQSNRVNRLIEQEIPIGAFPSGAVNRKVRLFNPYRFYNLFLSQIYFKRWQCITNAPFNP